MNFTKIVASIFYNDIKIALKTFIDCLEFTIIGLDLNFGNKRLEQKVAEDIAGFLSGLEELDKQNRLAIQKDYIDHSGETFEYIQFYLEELDQEELTKIVGKKTDNSPMEIRLLQKLRLVHLGLYPDEKCDNGSFAIFDYSIDIKSKYSLEHTSGYSSKWI